MISHGEVTFSWDDDLLEIGAKGPFNESGLKICITSIQKSILNKSIKSWRRIEVWDDETLGSPVVVSLAKEASHWYKNQGCFAVAIVISNDLQSYILEHMIKSGSAIFHDVATAKSWLNEQKP